MLAGCHAPLSIILKQRMDSVNSMCSAVNCLQEIKDHQKDDETELQPLRNMFKESVATVWQIWGPDACRCAQGCSEFVVPLVAHERYRLLRMHAHAHAVSAPAQSKTSDTGMWQWHHCTHPLICQLYSMRQPNRVNKSRAHGAICDWLTHAGTSPPQAKMPSS